MDKYQYSPNEIDRMDYFRTSELVFEEVAESSKSKERLRYADEINW